MRIEFLKMQGLGNDFLVFDAPPDDTDAVIDAQTIRALADRHTGIGFDQALLLDAPRSPRAQAAYRVFNSDGGEVEQCGNGARCVAALIYSRHPELGRELALDSRGGIVHARIEDDGMVAVNMGVPDFEPRSLPMDVAARSPTYSVAIEGSVVEFCAVSLGNPHIVLRVPDVEHAPVARLGPLLERHPWFAKRTNVGFMQIVDPAHLRLRVFERGAGETRACGTGACAAVAVGRFAGLLDAEVQVDLPGGRASITWQGEGQPIWLTGPATMVFSGTIDI